MYNKKRVVILSGGYDPIHSGHIEMFKAAKLIGDFVVVCLNSDAWLKKKKGINFLDFEERRNIISSLIYVDDVIGFEDDSEGSAINGIKAAVDKYKHAFTNRTMLDYGEIYSDEPIETEFVFANGGDRKPNSTPTIEQKYCEENGIELVWNIGGEKFNSSSWILNRYRDWHFEMTDRLWGNYKVIYQDSNKKVKIIEIEPGKAISLQTHSQRSEHWVVVEGTATVYLETDKSKREEIVYRNESIYVPVGAKHKLSNKTNEMLQIVEVQIGEYLGEDDIVRYDC